MSPIHYFIVRKCSRKGEAIYGSKLCILDRLIASYHFLKLFNPTLQSLFLSTQCDLHNSFPFGFIDSNLVKKFAYSIAPPTWKFHRVENGQSIKHSKMHFVFILKRFQEIHGLAPDFSKKIFFTYNIIFSRIFFWRENILGGRPGLRPEWSHPRAGNARRPAKFLLMQVQKWIIFA